MSQKQRGRGREREKESRRDIDRAMQSGIYRDGRTKESRKEPERWRERERVSKKKRVRGAILLSEVWYGRDSLGGGMP